MAAIDQIREPSLHRPRGKPLGLTELVAIALGGMVGGGIFTILGLAVVLVGPFTPVAIMIGGMIAALAAYSYIKLGVYYQDEGATYSFFKKTYPASHFAAAAIGWFVIFGYISTMALYAYTFASYTSSSFSWGADIWLRKLLAGAVLAVFCLVNLWSVRGMGKIEDLMVYTKLVILAVISLVLMKHGQTDLPTLAAGFGKVSVLNIMIVSSVTFVAYEGFQLVINAVKEMERPAVNIPRAIYGAIFLAVLIYVVIALGALLAIPTEDLINNQEYALAAGAGVILGKRGAGLVILGAVLATSSAISGTVFGASRQMAVIAGDGYLPRWLASRKKDIPANAILTMGGLALGLIMIGGLELILEFGSITFLLVSLLMALANFKIREKTGSATSLTLIAIVGLALGAVLILYYELHSRPVQMLFILGLYVTLTAGAWRFSSNHTRSGLINNLKRDEHGQNGGD